METVTNQRSHNALRFVRPALGSARKREGLMEAPLMIGPVVALFNGEGAVLS